MAWQDEELEDPGDDLSAREPEGDSASDAGAAEVAAGELSARESEGDSASDADAADAANELAAREPEGDSASDADADLPAREPEADSASDAAATAAARARDVELLCRLVGLGEPQFDRDDVAQLSGVDADVSLRRWRAMGFAQVPVGETAFTETDVTMLRSLTSLLDVGAVAEDDVLRLARLMGASFSRLADAQMEIVAEVLDRLGPPGGGARRDRLADALGPGEGSALDLFERSMAYVWRRHMVSAIARWLALEGEPDDAVLTVAFADLSDFSAFSKEAEPDVLASVIETFERAVVDAVAAGGGRVVKLIGDEVLFTAPTGAAAVEICLDIIDALALDERVPPVHCGVAEGATLAIGGDIFGPTVNLASRLTDVARGGSVAVERSLADQLDDHPRLELRRLRRRRNLKGIGNTAVVVVTRNDDAGDAPAHQAPDEPGPVVEPPTGRPEAVSGADGQPALSSDTDDLRSALPRDWVAVPAESTTGDAEEAGATGSGALGDADEAEPSADGTPARGEAEGGATAPAAGSGSADDPLARAMAGVRRRLLDAPFATSADEATVEAYVEGLAALSLQLVGNSDPRRPRLVRGSGPIPGDDAPIAAAILMKAGLDNPDTDYWWAPLDPTLEYVITGRRGTTRDLVFQVLDGNYLDGRGLASSCAHVSAADLGLDAGSAIEIALVPERAAARDGMASIALSDEARWLLVRETRSDWGAEESGELSITCLDFAEIDPPGGASPGITAAEGAPNGGRPGRAKDAGAVRSRAAELVRGGADLWLQFGPDVETELVPALAIRTLTANEPLPPVNTKDGLPSQFSSVTRFELADHDALVLNIVAHEAPYQGVQLANHWFISLDSLDRQTSLSGDQVVVDEDGLSRVVVSSRDPGVANWLDTTGLDAGVVFVRWQGRDPLTPPTTPLAAVVPLGRLDEYLHPDTESSSRRSRRRAASRRRDAYERRHPRPRSRR